MGVFRLEIENNYYAGADFPSDGNGFFGGEARVL